MATWEASRDLSINKSTLLFFFPYESNFKLFSSCYFLCKLSDNSLLCNGLGSRMISCVIPYFLQLCMWKLLFTEEKASPQKLCHSENWGPFPIDANNITGCLSTAKELLCWKIICCCCNMFHNLKENPCNLRQKYTGCCCS